MTSSQAGTRDGRDNINIYSVGGLAEALKLGKFVLPAIQRGFVWKIHQIENLWDSILRGYPIGAFTAAELPGGQFEILDGQQRATALALAFDGREDDDSPTLPAGVIGRSSPEAVLNASYGKWQIYIDLLKPARAGKDGGKDDEREFIFRVATQARPWGAPLGNNWETLHSPSIHQALNAYGESGLLDGDAEYYQADLRSLYPWEAVAPVPFRFFLSPDVARAMADGGPEAAARAVWRRLQKWLARYEAKRPSSGAGGLPEKLGAALFGGEAAKDRIKRYYNHCGVRTGEDDFYQKTGDYFYTLADIAAAVWKRVFNSENIAVFTPPVLTAAALGGTAEEGPADIEKIFVRINTGGTPISAEELNYSLLKFHLKDDAGPEIIKKLERKCARVMPPALFVSIAYRLYKAVRDEGVPNQAPNLTELDPKQFGRELRDKDKLEGFKNFIEKWFLNDERYGGKVLDDEARAAVAAFTPDPGKNRASLLTVYEVLSRYDEEKNKGGLPAPLFMALAPKAKELVFLLWYALINKGLPPDSRRITAVIAGLFLGTNDYSLACRHIWPLAKSRLADAERFWGPELFERALPKTPPALRSPANPIDTQAKSNDWFDDEARRIYEKRKKDFLLFAQREYIDRWFKKELTELDEINALYDFDHILPHKYIEGKGEGSGVGWEFKFLYNGLGNLRAWPYSLNRNDGAKAGKFNPQAAGASDKELKRWRKFFALDMKEGEEPALTAALLSASFCDKDPFWLSDDDWEGRITDKEAQKEISRAIADRAERIYGEWRETLKDVGPILETAAEARDDPETFLRRGCFSQNVETYEDPDEKGRKWLRIAGRDDFLIGKYYADNRLTEEKNIYFRFSVGEGRKAKNEIIDGVNHWIVKSRHSHYALLTLLSSGESARAGLFLEMLLVIHTLYPEPDPEATTGPAERFAEILHPDLKRAMLETLDKMKTFAPGVRDELKRLLAA